ncbi:all-trans-retinol 13,14-reductase [Aureococcus anophagefferens]|nr:all-trans-retinol 13,14-reductase [Aureococcus anophagefferens]
MSLITVEISEDAYDVVLAILMGLAWTVANVVGGCMVFGLYAMAMRRPSAAPKGFLPRSRATTAPRPRGRARSSATRSTTSPGCMHEFADGGFTFDTGVHSSAEKYGKLMDMGVAAAAARRLGAPRIRMRRLRLRLPARRRPAATRCARRDRFVADLAKRWPAYEGRIRRYVALCKTLCRKFYGFASAAVDEVIRGDCGIDDEDLVATLTGYAGNYGLAPSEASFFVHAGVASHYMGGAYVPVGGPQAIADALVATVNAYGGRVLMRAAVERVVLSDAGRAVGVQLEDDDKTLKLLPGARREVEWADAILNPASEDFVEQGISHLSLFVGFDTTAAELDLPSQNQCGGDVQAQSTVRPDMSQKAQAASAGGVASAAPRASGITLPAPSRAQRRRAAN